MSCEKNDIFSLGIAILRMTLLLNDEDIKSLNYH